MTTLVRSVFVRRNPRNVPLDLYNRNTGDVAGESSRVTDEYFEILVETVRGIGETIGRMSREGLFARPLQPHQWKLAGARLSQMLRDLTASIFIIVLYRDEIWRRKALKSYGNKKPKEYSAEQIQQEYEERAELFGQWIQAACDFRARPEIAGSRIGVSGGTQGEMDQLASDIQQQISSIQASWSAGSMFLHLYTAGQVEDLFYMVVDLVKARGFSKISDSFKTLDGTPLAVLRKEVQATRKLAEKGEPKNVSRKLAAEAAIREGDELKQNPFLRQIF